MADKTLNDQSTVEELLCKDKYIGKESSCLPFLPDNCLLSREDKNVTLSKEVNSTMDAVENFHSDDWLFHGSSSLEEVAIKPLSIESKAAYDVSTVGLDRLSNQNSSPIPNQLIKASSFLVNYNCNPQLEQKMPNNGASYVKSSMYSDEQQNFQHKPWCNIHSSNEPSRISDVFETVSRVSYSPLNSSSDRTNVKCATDSMGNGVDVSIKVKVDFNEAPTTGISETRRIPPMQIDKKPETSDICYDESAGMNSSESAERPKELDNAQYKTQRNMQNWSMFQQNNFKEEKYHSRSALELVSIAPQPTKNSIPITLNREGSSPSTRIHDWRQSFKQDREKLVSDSFLTPTQKLYLRLQLILMQYTSPPPMPSISKISQTCGDKIPIPTFLKSESARKYYAENAEHCILKVKQAEYLCRAKSDAVSRVFHDDTYKIAFCHVLKGWESSDVTSLTEENSDFKLLLENEFTNDIAEVRRQHRILNSIMNTVYSLKGVTAPPDFSKFSHTNFYFAGVKLVDYRWQKRRIRFSELRKRKRTKRSQYGLAGIANPIRPIETENNVLYNWIVDSITTEEQDYANWERKSVEQGTEKERAGQSLPWGFSPKLVHRALGAHSVIRSLSTCLHIMPFSPLAFLRALVLRLRSPLLDEVHVDLIRIVYASYLKGRFTKGMNRWLDLQYLDHVTWPTYLLELIVRLQAKVAAENRRARAADLYEDDDSEDFNDDSTTDDLSSISQASSALHYIEYHLLPLQAKIEILEFLCDSLLDSDWSQAELEYRCRTEYSAFNVDADGSVIACILCNRGGTLICCEGCPRAFHPRCIAGKHGTDVPNWRCFECRSNLSDPSADGLRVSREFVSDFGELWVVGGYIMKYVPGEDSDHSNCQLLSPYEVFQLGKKIGPVRAATFPFCLVNFSEDCFSSVATIEPTTLNSTIESNQGNNEGLTSEKNRALASVDEKEAIPFLNENKQTSKEDAIITEPSETQQVEHKPAELCVHISFEEKTLEHKKYPCKIGPSMEVETILKTKNTLFNEESEESSCDAMIESAYGTSDAGSDAESDYGSPAKPNSKPSNIGENTPVEVSRPTVTLLSTIDPSLGNPFLYTNRYAKAAAYPGMPVTQRPAPCPVSSTRWIAHPAHMVGIFPPDPTQRLLSLEHEFRLNHIEAPSHLLLYLERQLSGLCFTSDGLPSSICINVRHAKGVSELILAALQLAQTAHPRCFRDTWRLPYEAHRSKQHAIGQRVVSHQKIRRTAATNASMMIAKVAAQEDPEEDGRSLENCENMDVDPDSMSIQNKPDFESDHHGGEMVESNKMGRRLRSSAPTQRSNNSTPPNLLASINFVAQEQQQDNSMGRELVPPSGYYDPLLPLKLWAGHEDEDGRFSSNGQILGTTLLFGRRCYTLNEQKRLPPYLARKAARQGSHRPIPYFGYIPSSEDAKIPFFCQWMVSVSKTRTAPELAVHLRALETCIDYKFLNATSKPYTIGSERYNAQTTNREYFAKTGNEELEGGTWVSEEFVNVHALRHWLETRSTEKNAKTAVLKKVKMTEKEIKSQTEIREMQMQSVAKSAAKNRIGNIEAEAIREYKNGITELLTVAYEKKLPVDADAISLLRNNLFDKRAGCIVEAMILATGPGEVLPQWDQIREKIYDDLFNEAHIIEKQMMESFQASISMAWQQVEGERSRAEFATAREEIKLRQLAEKEAAKQEIRREREAQKQREKEEKNRLKQEAKAKAKEEQAKARADAAAEREAQREQQRLLLKEEFERAQRDAALIEQQQKQVHAEHQKQLVIQRAPPIQEPNRYPDKEPRPSSAPSTLQEVRNALMQLHAQRQALHIRLQQAVSSRNMSEISVMEQQRAHLESGIRRLTGILEGGLPEEAKQLQQQEQQWHLTQQWRSQQQQIELKRHQEQQRHYLQQREYEQHLHNQHQADLQRQQQLLYQQQKRQQQALQQQWQQQWGQANRVAVPVVNMSNLERQNHTNMMHREVSRESMLPRRLSNQEIPLSPRQNSMLNLDALANLLETQERKEIPAPSTSKGFQRGASSTQRDDDHRQRFVQERESFAAAVPDSPKRSIELEHRERRPLGSVPDLESSGMSGDRSIVWGRQAPMLNNSSQQWRIEDQSQQPISWRHDAGTDAPNISRQDNIELTPALPQFRQAKVASTNIPPHTSLNIPPHSRNLGSFGRVHEICRVCGKPIEGPLSPVCGVCNQLHHTACGAINNINSHSRSRHTCMLCVEAQQHAGISLPIVSKRARSAPSSKSKLKAISARRPQTSHEFLESKSAVPVIADRAWLLNSMQIESVFVPQVGDQLWYFAAGHRELLTAHCEEEFILNAKRKAPILLTAPSSSSGALCELTSISYELPKKSDMSLSEPIVVAVLKLTPLGSRGVRPFMVSYWPTDSADFVVPVEKVMLAENENWKQGDEMRLLFADGKHYGGRISTLRRGREGCPVWEGVEIAWDDGNEVSYVNLWELERPITKSASKKGNRKQSGEKRLNALQEEKLGLLTQNNQLEILATLSSLLDQNAQLSRPFMDPVTDVIAPNYTSEIALPMNLQLILDRLGVGYYRHFQAVIADLQLIATNCEAYNGPDVLLSKQARKLIGAAVLAVEGTRDKGDQQDPDLGTPGESKKRRRPKTLD